MTRVMALPGVQNLLPTWLRTERSRWPLASIAALAATAGAAIAVRETLR
ncbi:hypothetical protein [Streptomyces sp. NPDC102283]